jgi:hypothetical protein
VLLSMLEADSPLYPFSAALWRSLWRSFRAWAAFYLLSALLWIGVGLAPIVLLRVPRLGTVVFFGLLVAAMLIYARLLGRLVWCCGEHTVARRE